MIPPSYTTKHLTIKPYETIDEDRFVEIAIDPLSVKFIGGANGVETEERALFKKISEIYARKEGKWFWVWGIYKNNKLCGHLELKETDHTSNNELEIIYMIHPDERGKGIMTEVFSFFKEEQNNWQKRIIATVDKDNFYSLALMKKWGIEKTETIVEEEDEYFKISLVC